MTEDLKLSVYVRSNQSGAQVFAWVVLPADIDPDTKAPSYLMVPGTTFNRPDRWQKLELAEMLPAIEEQARVLRASSRRPVSLKGAYLAAGGGQPARRPGADGHLPGRPRGRTGAAGAGRRLGSRPIAAPARATRRRGHGAGRITSRRDRSASGRRLPAIRFKRGVLSKLDASRRYVPWLPVAIDAPGANPIELRRSSFDVLVTDESPDPRSLAPAVDRGMYLMPRLSGATEDGGAGRALHAMAGYPSPARVLMWSIGDRLGAEREVQAARRQEVDNGSARSSSAVHDGSDDLGLATAVDRRRVPAAYAGPPSNLDVIGLDLPIWGGRCRSWRGSST